MCETRCIMEGATVLTWISFFGRGYHLFWK